MRITLKRKYHSNGTNGKLLHDAELICKTIELPWLENRRNVSCIPEGIYSLTKRNTKTRGDHLIVNDVPGRSGILLHPANNALKELKGCIAPVTSLTGPGLGSSSRKATTKLQNLLFEALDQNEEVILIIQKDIAMNIIERVKAPTPKFFKVLRNIGLSLAAAGGAILASPIALPAGIITLGGYLVAGGSVLGAVSQTTIKDSTND
ncbi:MAG: DUF5675 family protein [Ekhidna sp.]|uniref:DUF5675 family protein n=1 Tax=Ekhidna sp. TaxID=2608089 RepID=UPI003298CE7A